MTVFIIPYVHVFNPLIYTLSLFGQWLALIHDRQKPIINARFHDGHCVKCLLLLWWGMYVDQWLMIWNQQCTLLYIVHTNASWQDRCTRGVYLTKEKRRAQKLKIEISFSPSYFILSGSITKNERCQLYKYFVLSYQSILSHPQLCWRQQKECLCLNFCDEELYTLFVVGLTSSSLLLLSQFSFTHCSRRCSDVTTYIN